MNILDRFKKNTTLTSQQWDQFEIDIYNESIKYVCEKYNLKKTYVKAYKKSILFKSKK